MTSIYIKNDTLLPARHKHDLYRTELNLIREAVKTFLVRDSQPHNILDIGAGDGRWGKITKQYTGAQHLIGVEIMDVPNPGEFTLWCPNQDFLTWEIDNVGIQFDVIVSNPPYYAAEDIIRRALSILAPRGTALFLLRLAFQAGVSRYNNFWNEYPLSSLGVLSRRPSFYGNGTNGTDYGIFCWRKGRDGEFSYFSNDSRAWITKLINYERD
jgi:hypothetical protein